tara:strand:+ start:4571 stop:5083 length:513 start_codon:yes stop_codon:yes gene_type:complete
MNIFKPSILIIFFFLILTKFSYSNDKIAILDLDSILEKTNYGKNIIKELNLINEENLQSLKKIETKIKLDQENLKAQKNLLSEEDLQIKVNKLNSEIREFQIKKNNLVNDFNLKKKDKLDQFFKIIIPEIEKYINQNNINLVFDKKNIFIANRKNNITDEVVKIIDEKLK